MCIATISLIAGIAGAATSAVGTYEQGAYSAQVANNNAKIATQNAEYSREAGKVAASNASQKGAAEGAQIKTAEAANGIDVNTGSAVDVQTSQRQTSEQDVETILHNADLTAYGYTTQTVNDKAQAQQDQVGADFGAAGSLLSDASSIGGKKWGTGSTGTSSGSMGGWDKWSK